MKEQALIVNSSASLDNLNDLLDDGWSVLHTCGMPAGAMNVQPGNYAMTSGPTCLVVIGKEEVGP